jgi:urease accessory protein
MAFLYLLSSGGGIVQGDRLRMDLVCEAGSAVHVTTQAATKIYGMAQNFATQCVNISAQAGALVEYMPDPVIPFAGARFYQRTRLSIDPTATLIYGETLYPGRAAFAERHAYSLYYSHCEAARMDGELLLADVLVLDPLGAAINSPGRLGQYDYMSTLYAITPVVAARVLARHLQDCVKEQDAVVAGVSELPHGCGAVVRILGLSSQTVQAALHAAWGAVRQFVMGSSLPRLRKY